MKNVTQIFKEAISDSGDWMMNTFFIAMEIVKKNGIEISFWEGEENWASVIANRKTVGYIWRKYPLIAAEKLHIQNLRLLLENFKSINFIEVNSLNIDLLKIDDSQILNYMDEYIEDLSSFTMEELWFKTNSI